MYDNPKNGTFTIIMNQLKDDDAGYYWCMTAGDKERKASKELKVLNGMRLCVSDSSLCQQKAYKAFHPFLIPEQRAELYLFLRRLFFSHS